MNILASYKWIREYLKTDASPEEFAREMSLKSMSVESTQLLSDRFKNVVIGEVVEIKNHPNAEKLKIVMTDIGGKQIEIVCGGKNLCKDQKVVVALPGAKVLWHGQSDLMELKEAEIRGVKSFGMICAPAEIGFDKVECQECDIWDLTALVHVQNGTTFLEVFDLDDALFDIEITTNRPDAMSIVGLAREGAVVVDGSFTYTPLNLPVSGKGKAMSVKIIEQDLCSRYMAVVIDGVKVGPSPMWLQMKLLLAGHRPINNIVDITNYVLHELGQPLHAFDFDKLEGGEIIVRHAKDGERFAALDGKNYELKNDQLVIADSLKPVAVAGVMGGQESGVQAKTTTIVFEAATFNEVSVRKTARALNLYSDSQLLFEKGLSAEAPAFALARAIELTLEIAGGNVESEIFDVRSKPYQPLIFPMNPDVIRARIGVDITNDQITKILNSLGFDVLAGRGAYSVQVPFWRDHDIEESIDFAEEIARIYGYHQIPAKLPQSAPPSYVGDVDLIWEIKTKEFMARCGYTELYGYSFISSSDSVRYGFDPKQAISIYNPLSVDLTHLRTSLIPSFLRDIKMNQDIIQTDKLFEVARVYIPTPVDLPQERTQFVFGEYGVSNAEQAFLNTKGILENWLKQVGLEYTLERLSDDQYWHPARSATILVTGQEIGVIGFVASQYTIAFGIDKPVCICSIDFQTLVTKMKADKRYEKIPNYPAMRRDVSIILAERTEFSDLERVIRADNLLIREVSVVDTYRGEGVETGKKSITLALTLRADDRTLESKEADEILFRVDSVLRERFSAIIR